MILFPQCFRTPGCNERQRLFGEFKVQISRGPKSTQQKSILYFRMISLPSRAWSRKWKPLGNTVM